MLSEQHRQYECIFCIARTFCPSKHDCPTKYFKVLNSSMICWYLLVVVYQMLLHIT